MRRDEKRRVRKVRRKLRVKAVVVEEEVVVVSVVEIGRGWDVILGVFRDLEGKLVDCFRRAECRSVSAEAE